MLDYLQYVWIAISVIIVSITIIEEKDKFIRLYIYSIPVILLIYLFTNALVILPVYLLSLVSAAYMYTQTFFSAYLAEVSIVLFAGYEFQSDSTWIAIDISISSAIILTMMFDNRLKSYTQNNDSVRGKVKKKEVYRDYVQSLVGVAILIVVFVEGLLDSRVIITLSVLILYAAGNYFYLHRKNMIGDFLWSFERDDTPLGIGSIWFAAGILLAFAIINSISILYIVLFVLVIGDSAATIVGVNVKTRRLFFNKRKSVGGFLALFVLSAVFGYFVIGYTGIIFALVGAIVESATQYPLDDNYIIPLALTALSVAI